MKDITLLIAHPDDEALFCWPVLDRVKRIVCASNDSENPERKWCRERGLCLEEVGKLLGAEVVHLPCASEFYRMHTRDGSLKSLATVLMGHLRGSEIIFTHNAWGEYGHIDHILCHHIARTVQARTGCELLVSDIAVTETPAWFPITPWIQSTNPVAGPYRASSSVMHEMRLDRHIDRPLFDRIKQVYDNRGCWTWSFPVVERCRVYSL